MKRTDRFLAAIAGGALLLVALTVAVVLMRPEPSYREEETASDVAQNYLLALRREEYERAYGYLSPTLPGYPASVEEFYEEYDWHFYEGDSSTRLEALPAREPLPGLANVTVRVRNFWQGGLFDSGESVYTFEMTLQQEEGEWKITDAGAYFAACWREREGCE